MSAGGAAGITAENFSPPNSAADPGEAVTANFPVLNTGDGNTTNLVATLQNSGGVTPVTTSQNYGVVIAAGPTVSRSFQFIANGTCGNNITATFHLQDGPLDLGNVTYSFRLGTVIGGTTQTFSNSAAITIPASGTGATTGAPATPYPSSITVSGAPTTISKLTVTIKNFNHTFPDDVDILLVSPTGRKMIIMSDAGSSTLATNLTITLDDDAASALPDGTGIASGTFKPSNYGTVQDPFPAPAPVGPYLTPQTGGTDTLTSAFTGAAGGDPNGTWSLYVVDDANLDSGNINGGWEIALTSPSSNLCVGNQAPVIQNGPPPSPVIVGSPYSFTFVASANPAPTFTPTGTFPPGLGVSAGGVLSGTATSGGNGTFPGLSVTASNSIVPDAIQNFSLVAVTRADNYIASFGLTGGNAGRLFDYDGDGIQNLAEYAFGLDPTTAGVVGLPVVTVKDYSGTKYLSITFQRSSLATDLTYVAQASSDLVNWSDLATSSAGAVASGPGFVAETGSAPNFIVEARDTVPVTGAPMRFIRVKVTSP